MLNYTECSDLLDIGAGGKGDPDISGPGVISAFIVSAYITLLAVLGSYFFGLVDAGLLRPVDRLIINVPSRATKHPRTHVALRKAIMATSDQQIVTGIAILAAGFQGLRVGHISVYHFQIVVYLAWMSSSVHLSALTLLRPFMHHHRGVLIWRLVGMLVLLIMLLVALVPTVSNDFAVVTVADDVAQWTEDNPDRTLFGMPAICFWGQLYDDGVNPDAVLSFILLFVSYVWKMGGLFVVVRSAWWRTIRNPLDHLLETPLALLARRYKSDQNAKTLWAFRMCLVVHLNTTAILEVMDSFSAALWLSVLGLIYGTMQILIPRQLVQFYTPEIQEHEMEWGFGQLVALVLLVQPLGAVSEHIWLKGKEEEHVYLERHLIDSGNDIVELFDQKGPHLQQIRGVTMLHFMSTYVVPDWNEEGPSRTRLKALLFTSKTFKLLVWMVHAGVAAISILIFYFDYYNIGYSVQSNWFWVGAGIGTYLAVSTIVGMFIVPHSRLSRTSMLRRSTFESADSEKALGGTGLEMSNSTPGYANKRNSLRVSEVT